MNDEKERERDTFELNFYFQGLRLFSGAIRKYGNLGRKYA